MPIAKNLKNLGFTICAIRTAKYLNDNKIETQYIKKVIEGRPNAVDAMLSKEIQLVINTEGNSIKDSFSLRQTYFQQIPYYTTIQGANAATLAIKELKSLKLKHQIFQSYFE